MGAQMSKTDGIHLNTIGWKLDDDPQPMLYIGPTRKNVESISKTRLRQMFRQVRSLWDGLAKGKAETITEKFVNGVRIGFGWAGSATELASHPAAVVLLDEYDRMRPIPGEGDPVTLAEARISTFPWGTIVVVSTPLEGLVETETLDTGLTHWALSDDVSSPTWRLWQEGTRHEWAWPCPSCGAYFVPRKNLLWYPDGATPAQAQQAARLTCPHCGDQISDNQKGWMNDRGRFVAPGQRLTPDGQILGDAPDTPTASFWVSGLCSSWRSFGQRAAALVAATASGNPARLRATINTAFGEVYKPRGDAPEWTVVQACAQEYDRGTVPVGTHALTSGVDVQKNRLVYTVRGWGDELESWLIEGGELWGDTDQPDVWHRLEHLLHRQWDGLGIAMMLVDSGYRRDQVYAFCRRNKALAAPSKGRLTMDSPYRATPVDVNRRGKIIRNGLKLWLFSSDLAKCWVHGRVEWPQEQPGAWHVHRDIDEAYCRQIVAEERTVVQSTGKPLWLVHGDNHYLDAEALAYIAARIQGLDQANTAARNRARKAPGRPTGGGIPPGGGWLNTGSTWL